MFDHLVIDASNYEASKEFFLAALAPIGLEIVAEDALGVELSADGKTSLCIRRVESRPSHLHLAFVAQRREQVDAFYAAALANGGVDNGPPGIRAQYSGTYYAAFVIDPDGHNIELVYHEDSEHA
ncbi:MAG: VOC family protein [Pseudomonadota bacterium]